MAENQHPAKAAEQHAAGLGEANALIDAPHMPADAGEYAPALQRILSRIPNGWGRWISLDAGWYPIIGDCDEQLAAIDPNYVVHQVKEKLGGLRYYCRPSTEDLPDQQQQRFTRIVAAAEATAARTCERCSATATLRHRRGWLKTLCNACAAELNYP